MYSVWFAVCHIVRLCTVRQCCPVFNKWLASAWRGGVSDMVNSFSSTFIFGCKLVSWAKNVYLWLKQLTLTQAKLCCNTCTYGCFGQQYLWDNITVSSETRWNEYPNIFILSKMYLNKMYMNKIANKSPNICFTLQQNKTCWQTFIYENLSVILCSCKL